MEVLAAVAWPAVAVVKGLVELPLRDAVAKGLIEVLLPAIDVVEGIEEDATLVVRISVLITLVIGIGAADVSIGSKAKESAEEASCRLFKPGKTRR